MRERRKTQSDCAEYIGVKPPTFNQKLNNIRPFSLTEAEKLSSLLDIENNEFAYYFFCSISSVAQPTKTSEVQ
jgi:transcriptional regulator with XRE-family HTH domain